MAEGGESPASANTRATPIRTIDAPQARLTPWLTRSRSATPILPGDAFLGVLLGERDQGDQEEDDGPEDDGHTRTRPSGQPCLVALVPAEAEDRQYRE